MPCPDRSSRCFLSVQDLGVITVAARSVPVFPCLAADAGDGNPIGLDRPAARDVPACGAKISLARSGHLTETRRPEEWSCSS